jgi:hypothetical protein
MMRITGLWWIVIGVIHGLVGTIIFFDQWRAIAQDGWFNVIAPNPLAPIFDCLGSALGAIEKMLSGL